MYTYFFHINNFKANGVLHHQRRRKNEKRARFGDCACLAWRFGVLLVQHCRIFSQDHAKKERFIRCAFHGVVGHSPVPCLHGWDPGAVGCEVNWESDGFLNLFFDTFGYDFRSIFPK